MKQVCAFIFILMLAAPVRAEKQLTLVISPAPPTFQAKAVLEAAYAKIGIDLKILHVPNKRAMEDLITGVVDGDVARIAGLDKEHPQLIQITVPLNRVDGVAFTCNDAIRIKSLEDLKGLRVGIHAGILYAKQLTQGMNTTSINKWDKLFDLLYAGRIDAVIAGRDVAKGQLLRHGSDCLHANEPPLHTHNVYHYLNKRHQDIVPVITRTLQGMQDSGEIAEILAKPAEVIRPDMSLPYGVTPP